MYFTILLFLNLNIHILKLFISSISFCNKSIEDVKNFLVQYCGERNQTGFYLLREPLSIFYEALCVGLNFNENVTTNDYTQPNVTTQPNVATNEYTQPPVATNSGANAMNQAEVENVPDRRRNPSLSSLFLVWFTIYWHLIKVLKEKVEEEGVKLERNGIEPSPFEFFKKFHSYNDGNWASEKAEEMHKKMDSNKPLPETENARAREWEIYREVTGKPRHGRVLGLGAGQKPSDVFTSSIITNCGKRICLER
ncbi:hypothetical protein Ddye_020182 [Dipteronia dyeriana]|uniref:Uncharacterized protein n=1 Tax=Dipteronia dyeriana TaxID=168575 RepID=A0AAD9WWE9_9ROSI|nr:hypothetical protein Ddye_020182 [Dipteronia dyeriana]